MLLHNFYDKSATVYIKPCYATQHGLLPCDPLVINIYTQSLYLIGIKVRFSTILQAWWLWPRFSSDRGCTLLNTNTLI